jgi:uncharacterized membrane protein
MFASGVGTVTDIDARTGSAVPTGGLVGLAHLIYALHGFSALTGLLGAAFVVLAFLSGWPSIIAVILNYLKRSDVRGTFLESHFRWQIRTFWFALLWAAVALLLALTVIGLPAAWVTVVLAGLWVLYRIVRGWLALVSERPMPVPAQE